MWNRFLVVIKEVMCKATVKLAGIEARAKL